MEDGIRLNNYFFTNITNYTPNRNDVGTSTRRMPYGKLKTYHSGVVYYDFEIELQQVTSTKLGHLIYLDNLCKPKDDSEAQYIDFWDNTDGNALDLIFPIKVIIPENGFDFDREEGGEETYSVELKLEQIIEEQLQQEE